MIDPHFLEELLSSEPHMNVMDITKELEQQEELTPDQVKRGRTVSQQTRGRRYTGYAREQRHLKNKCRDPRDL